MGCNCGGTSTTAAAGPMMSHAAAPNTYIVYRSDGTTVEVQSETAARMEVTKAGGGSWRKK